MFNKMKHLEKFVSVFVLIVILILVSSILLIGNFNKWFASTRFYYTYLPSATGLEKGIDIKLKGVGFKIGTLEDFNLTGDERVLIKISILEKYISKIRSDSVLYMRKPTIGILGKVYFEISSGSAELEELPNDSFIPSSQSFEGKLIISSIDSSRSVVDEEDSDLNLPAPIRNFLNRINYILDPNRPYLKNVEEILFRIKNILTTMDRYGILSAVGTQTFQTNIENIMRNFSDITGRQLREVADRLVSIMSTIEATSNTVIGVRLPRLMQNLENVLLRAESVLRNLERSPIFGGRGSSQDTRRDSQDDRSPRRGSILLQ